MPWGAVGKVSLKQKQCCQGGMQSRSVGDCVARKRPLPPGTQQGQAARPSLVELGKGRREDPLLGPGRGQGWSWVDAAAPGGLTHSNGTGMRTADMLYRAEPARAWTVASARQRGRGGQANGWEGGWGWRWTEASTTDGERA